jgi:Restriction Endonuclease associating with ARP
MHGRTQPLKFPEHRAFSCARRALHSTECYQLIRGVLAAYATGGSFCVLCHARRPDLIENCYSVMRAVKSCVLRCRLQLLTSQELTAGLPRSRQNFLAVKYGITP